MRKKTAPTVTPEAIPKQVEVALAVEVEAKQPA